MGSISTWDGGGRFVGNFSLADGLKGSWLTVTRNDEVYYNDIDTTQRTGTLWFMSCPAGGAQTQVAGVNFAYAGGMVFDRTGDLLAFNNMGNGSGTADTFELPNPVPSTFPAGGGGMAINWRDDHLFAAQYDYAAEYAYPSGKLIGTVPGDPNGVMAGIAIDP